MTPTEAKHSLARRILSLARRHSEEDEGEVYRGYRSWVISGDHQKPGDWAGFMRLVCGKTHPDDIQPAWHIEWFRMTGWPEEPASEYLWISRRTASLILAGLLIEEATR